MPRTDLLDDEDVEDTENEDLDEDEDEDEDQEDEDDSDQEDDDEDEKPKRKAKRSSQPSNAAILKEIEQIKQIAQNSGTKSDQKKASKLEQTLNAMLENGADKGQIGVLYRMFLDLKEDLREESKEESKKSSAESLKERCMDAFESAFDRAAAKNPSLKWSKAEIISRAISRVERGSSYVDARNAYASGRMPSASTFERAITSVIETFEKETGNKSAVKKNESLDIGSSKLKGKSTKGSSKSKEVDVDSLNDFEREIYTSTLNSTKSKEFALEALQTVRTTQAEVRKSRK